MTIKRDLLTCSRSPKATPASPGHILLCGHAFVLGAVEATSKLVQTGKIESWSGDFKTTAKEAAKAGSPVGGVIMQQHIMQVRGD